jgi:hypothetical protein
VSNKRRPKWLPKSRLLRIILGLVLIVAGIIGFLPILGFWMVPLGVFVLSIDIPIVGRWWARLQAWWSERVEPVWKRRYEPWWQRNIQPWWNRLKEIWNSFKKKK